MSFVHYRIFDEDAEDEDPRYSSFVDLEAFEESDDEAPVGFAKAEKGTEVDAPLDDRTKVKPWDPLENFFSFI